MVDLADSISDLKGLSNSIVRDRHGSSKSIGRRRGGSRDGAAGFFDDLRENVVAWYLSRWNSLRPTVLVPLIASST